MAPTIRTHTQTRRGNRAGYVEHDDFEGLPVRQWRQEWVSIAPPPPVETAQKNDIWAIELPHGMPKDSNLLPTHTQELLRAARSGRLYKRPAPTEEDEAEAEAAPEKPEKKEEDPSTKGFQVRLWKQVPRNAEGPTISHLAKKRKGTVTLSSNLPAGNTSGPTVTKVTVRRIDAAGNPYTQTVTLTDGQAIDGEIISTTVVPAPVASTSGENAVATPARRRPPPPKRKAKGPGRGRKKKLPLPVSTRSHTAANPGAEGADGGFKPQGATDGVKHEGDNDESKNQDSEMADGDDDDEGDDDGDEGEDGEEGDEEDGEVGDSEKGTPAAHEGSVDQDIKNSPSVEPAAITATPVDSDAMDTSTDESVSTSSPSAGAPIPLQTTGLPPLQPHLTSRLEGSPLKNVLVPSPTESSAPALPILPATSAPEAMAIETSSEPVLEPLAAPVQSVETAPALEPIVQETPTVEIEEPVDTEMTEATPAQPEITTESDDLPSIDMEAGQAVVEEIVEATKPNDEPQPAEPLAVEVPVADETSAPEAPVQEDEPKAPSPVAEQPIASVEEPVPQAAQEPTPEQSIPPVTEPAEATETPALPPAAEAPAAEPITAPAAAPVEGVPATLLSLNPIETAPPLPLPILSANEPESPDLYSGLEAVLDKQTEPKDEASTDVPVPDPSPPAAPTDETPVPEVSVEEPAPPQDSAPEPSAPAPETAPEPASTEEPNASSAPAVEVPAAGKPEESEKTEDKSDDKAEDKAEDKVAEKVEEKPEEKSEEKAPEPKPEATGE